MTEQCYLAPGSEDADAQVRALAQRWSLAVAAPDQPAGLRLWVGNGEVKLGDSRPGAPGPIRVDFLDPAFLRRLTTAGPTREGLVRAVGARRGARPDVLDATAGLGQDAAILAAAGCPVTLVERSTVVAALLEDGIQRAGGDPRTAEIRGRMQLVAAESTKYLRELAGHQRPEVVYLDPMYAARRGGGRSGKSMQHLQALLGQGDTTAALLDAALGAARRRVVVKRQRRAAALEGPEPDFSVPGTSTRFDVYLRPADR